MITAFPNGTESYQRVLLHVMLVCTSDREQSGHWPMSVIDRSPVA